ncbi:LPXTG cell wall anchor domain-containing protein [Streptococcus dysgalactiae]|uniref:LPXTG cell wall anchor domain-containing protein n=1 Tax=Streptococcus dysgalactiae TaxID=1334 RepID=UPI0012AA7800|nr:LPXTG cell wall anchor domain-containing protein [Streptococcus dysgalactiae]QGH03379.1 LPXTG cell wall anchor domain-containing protein [Streptococcus dysgalactiae subsp. dysgalactiae]
MTKKQLLLMATISSVALLGSRVNADDVVPSDPSAPTPGVVVPVPTPDVPVTDSTVPTPEPSTPTPAPDVPAPDPNTPTPGTDSSTPTPTEPNTEPSTPTPVPEKPADPKPSDEPKPGEITPEIIDKVDPNTGSVTIKPVPVKPGTTIIGTQDSRLIVQDSQGNQSIVSAATFGGRVNDNGTVTIKDADGKEKTLPSTGEKSSILTYIGMALTTGLVLVFKNKKLQ